MGKISGILHSPNLGAPLADQMKDALSVNIAGHGRPSMFHIFAY
jgi:hypothetical protein